MNTQNTWGVVLLAGGFALLAISVAGATYFFENKPPAKPALVAVPTEGGAALRAQNANWQKTLQTVVDQENAGISPTSKIALELASRYEDVFGNETISPGERSQALTDLIQKNIAKPDIASAVTLKDLTVQNDAALDVYAELTLLILRQSSNVREYELVSFSRAMRQKNYSGIPELKEASVIYTRIQNALVIVPVPPTLAREHLAVVNSIGSLANIVNAMGRWNGDPLVGLTYLDSFISAENAVAASVETLFEATNKKEV